MRLAIQQDAKLGASRRTAGSTSDAELELWFPGLDLSHLDFKGQVDVRTIGKLIGQYVL